MKYLISILCWALIAFSCLADETQKIGINEHLNEYLPDNIQIINVDGERIELSSVIANKPTVLNFVYYHCPGICTPLMDGIAEVINLSNLQLGKDYQVVTISFDSSESSELALKKRNNYSMVVKKNDMEEGWLFFTADSANIARLTQATGFSYKKTGNDYIHTAGLILISPDGKITRYLNGTYFLPFEFKLAVIEASKGISGPTVNRILQFCYSYDPVGQAYVLNITKVAGILLIVIAGLVWLVLTLKPKRKTKS